ncbi:Protein tssc1 [Batrachochytrium dendrobatidis]|nr:Protein tssc1 [Batrachochytrium dendrobatidis]KAK5673531.1 Protein tssc1 [Batrachochytrium dendrobatidis]
MSVFGLGRQGRVLVAQLGDTERNRWIAGSSSLLKDNKIYLIDYDEDQDEITHAAYAHPDEILSISPAPTKADLFFSCSCKIEENIPILSTTLWRFSQIDSDESGQLKQNGSNVLEEVTKLIPDGGQSDIHQVLWEPAGDTSQIVAIGRKKLYIYSLAQKDLKATLSTVIAIPMDAESCIGCAAWDPHHTSQISVAIGRNIIGWNISTNSECFRIDLAHELPMRALDYNPNKPYHIVSGSDDCTIRIWDTRNTSTYLKNITDHSHWVWSVSFNRSHDQLLLSSSSDCQVNLDSVVSVSSVFFYDKNRFLSSESNGGDKFNDSSDDSGGNYHSKATDGLIASFDQHEEAVYSASWSAADPWIFASLSFDGRVVVNQVPREEKYRIMDC